MLLLPLQATQWQTESAIQYWQGSCDQVGRQEDKCVPESTLKYFRPLPFIKRFSIWAVNYIYSEELVSSVEGKRRDTKGKLEYNCPW